jgi:APA family basic amino acid/polyamine antiporter
MALTFGTYAVDGPRWAQRLVALAALLGLTAVNYRGITRTAKLARILVAASLLALVVIVAAILASGEADAAKLDLPSSLVAGGFHGIFQSAALLFFAFAGYARVATLGEEVLAPARTIPKAISIALAITVVLYLVVGTSTLAAAGPDGLAASSKPVATAVSAVDASWAGPVVRAGAAIASLGALLALIAGVGRTGLAMARNGDLPRWLASVHPRYRVPHHAELAVAAAAALLVSAADLRAAIGFSSFGVLTYYAVANAAAYTQAGAQRIRPRILNAVGLVACLALVAALPVDAVLAGSAVFAVGLAGRGVLRSRARHSDEFRADSPSYDR